MALQVGQAHPGVDSATQARQARTQQWVTQYHSVVFGYVYRLCGSVADAEDLTQQTFLAAHVCGDQLRDPSRVKSWLLAIARSRFLKWLAQRRPETASDVQLDLDRCGAKQAEHRDDDAMDGERLQAALNKLPASWRLMLTMYYYEQATYKEIAEALRIPLGTVMSGLARAKERLRRFYVASSPVPPGTGAAQNAAQSGAQRPDPKRQQCGDGS